LSLILDSGEVDGTDLFCGAGGTTRGAKRAGVPIRMAVNHWDLAIHNHNRWNPEVDHDIADVSAIDPRRYPRTTILLASPECKTWSMAAPGERVPELFDGTSDAYVDRSRVTMWDVPRFAAHHRYDLIIVENVVDVGASKHTENINAWLNEFVKLGYDYQVVSLNAMVCHPTPQSRDRWFACFWRRGNRKPDLEIRPFCWCEECGDVEGVQTWKKPTTRWGKYRQQYVYKCSKGHTVAPYAWPALSALDLGLPCPRIGDRARPLVPATLRRIAYGMWLYGPSIVQRSGNTFERRGYYRTWPAWQPLVTQTTTLDHGIAVPTAMLSQCDYKGPDAKRVYHPLEPTRTIVAGGNHQAVATAPAGFLVKNNGDLDEAKYRAYSPEEPMGTVVGTAITQSYVEVPPVVVDLAHTGSSPRYDGNRARPGDEPLPAQTAAATAAVIVPCGGSRDGQRARPADEPRRTQTGRCEDGLVVIPMRTHAAPREAGEPLGAVTTAHGGGHHVVRAPFVAELRNRGATAPADEPLATVTAGGNNFGVVEEQGVMVRMNGDESDAPSMATPMSGPLGTITGAANQGVVRFTVPYNRTGLPLEVEGPIGTITSVDRFGLVELEVDVSDCGFRMLTPPEAGAAQAFPADEPLEGTSRDIVRMYGQAVPPPMAQVLVERMVASLLPTGTG
jgi:DNA (cytosine-5)-methyltransferase 1